MALVRMILSTIAAATVAGCAAQPLQQMAPDRYPAFAYHWSTLHKCGESGQIDPDTAAMGIRYMEASLDNLQYSPRDLHAAIAQQQNAVPTQAECNRAAIAIRDRKQQIDNHNANVTARQEDIQRMLENTRSKQTYCNRIGTQVFCNTY